MQEWFTVAALSELALGELPPTFKGMEHIARRKWRIPGKSRRVAGKTKPVWEYHISLLPAQAQPFSSGRSGGEHKPRPSAKSLWQRYEKLADKHKQACEARLKALLLAETLQIGGVNIGEAMNHAAEQSGCSLASLYNWRRLTADYDKPDWLPALAAQYSAPVHAASAAETCPPPAWEALLSDYLRPSKPAFSACYRRVKAAAAEHGWSKMPSERALRTEI